MRPKLRRFGCHCPARFRFMCLRADSTPALMQSACQHLCWAEEWQSQATLMLMPLRVAEREKSRRHCAARRSSRGDVVLAKHGPVDSWPRCCRSETTRAWRCDTARYRACAMCRLCRRDRCRENRLATEYFLPQRAPRSQRKLNTDDSSSIEPFCILSVSSVNSVAKKLSYLRRASLRCSNALPAPAPLVSISLEHVVRARGDRWLGDGLTTLLGVGTNGEASDGGTKRRSMVHRWRVCLPQSQPENGVRCPRRIPHLESRAGDSRPGSNHFRADCHDRAAGLWCGYNHASESPD